MHFAIVKSFTSDSLVEGVTSMQKGFGNSVQRIVAKDYSIKPQQKSINKIKEMLKLLIKKPKKKSGSS